MSSSAATGNAGTAGTHAATDARDHGLTGAGTRDHATAGIHDKGLTGSHAHGTSGTHDKGLTGTHDKGLPGSAAHGPLGAPGTHGANEHGTTGTHGSYGANTSVGAAAKQTVADHMTKSGHHNTTVHERVAPGVTHENVLPKQHENVNTAIDKEIHQDHFHTSVQPIHDHKTLPEKHVHNAIPVEHREFDHGSIADKEAKIAAERSKFKDERIIQDTQHTHSIAPTVAGEHIHHHVHETIQPVVQREVVQPNVVHTTVPIHEVHHNAAQHHTTSALPSVSMDEFKTQGGSLSGRGERSDAFTGEPRSVGGALANDGAKYETNKPGLGAKLNPTKDADFDGKRGIMD